MTNRIRAQRYPILIGEHTVILLNLFIKPHDLLDDIWTYDYLDEAVVDQPKFAAEEFVRQLEDHWSPAFMMALRKAITDKLRESDKLYETNFAEEEEVRNENST